MKISNAKYKEDLSPLTDNCPCYACQNFSKAYLHHLHREKEMLAGILLSLHNIVYLHKLLENWKADMLTK
ncbi:MAG: tRNA-guanine transglycosylase [bacterium]|nr:tRNA-guanine transglycosylase [bacterium]